jgi:hypothetical protein
MVEFLPLDFFFTFYSHLKITEVAQTFWILFLHVISCVLSKAEKRVLADFFPNSSGHTVKSNAHTHNNKTSKYYKTVTRDRCYEFLKIFAEKSCKNIGVFDLKQS